MLTGFGLSINNVVGSDYFLVAKFGNADCDFLGTPSFDKRVLILYPNPVLDRLYVATQET